MYFHVFIVSFITLFWPCEKGDKRKVRKVREKKRVVSIRLSVAANEEDGVYVVLYLSRYLYIPTVVWTLGRV